MHAETTINGSSIPPAGMPIKVALSTILIGLPVKTREFGLTLDDNISRDEIGVMFSRMFDAEWQVSVRMRFQIGDAWNQLHTPDMGSERMGYLANLKARLPETVYNRRLKLFRQYGWVASKWPEAKRGDGKGWTFYVNNAHGEPAKKSKPESLPYFVVLRRFLKDGEEWQECAGTGDKRIMVRVPATIQVEPEI